MNQVATGEVQAHPRIVELLMALDASRAELVALLATVDHETLNKPSGGDTWSIAEVLEHLTMVEDGAGRLITKLHREVEASGIRETKSTSILDINSDFQVGGAEIRIAAPERVAPKGGVAPEESIQKLREIRSRLEQALLLASGWDLSAASHPHPLFGPLSGYQWALLVAQHERRHIRQLKRILKSEAAG